MAIKLSSLWERDGGMCWLCDQPVPHPDTSTAREMQATRDHVVPSAFGGSSNKSNLKLAHRSCNEMRGTRLIPGYETPPEQPTHNPTRPAHSKSAGRPPRPGPDTERYRWRFDAIENAWHVELK